MAHEINKVLKPEFSNNKCTELQMAIKYQMVIFNIAP